MRFQRIIEHVYCRPWLITAQGWDSIHRLVSERILRPQAERPKEDFFGDPLPQMRIDGNTAIIPVDGVIGRKFGMMEKQCGAVDVLDIGEDLKNAVSNSMVKTIILDVNSPGGTVGGVPELASQVAAANNIKPVFAFAGDMMCSAAYWISAGAERIYATPSSDVGSIGVFVPWIDRSKQFEEMGLSVDIIRAGKFKGMGYPGTSLTDEQRQLIQDDVDETYGNFAGFVTQYRTGVTSETMQGQSFSGERASKLGLVTGLVDDINGVLAVAQLTRQK